MTARLTQYYHKKTLMLSKKEEVEKASAALRYLEL